MPGKSERYLKLAAAGAVIFVASRASQGSDGNGDDPDNGNGDDPDNGNGDDPDNGNGGTNQKPTVSIDSLSENDGTLTVEADANDPDGTVVSYKWELFNEGMFVDQAQGKAAALNIGGSGDFKVDVRATDNDGATGTDSYNFSYQPQTGVVVP